VEYVDWVDHSGKTNSSSVQYLSKIALSEADLGMFSMFGRTGAPTKMGPPHDESDV